MIRLAPLAALLALCAAPASAQSAAYAHPSKKATLTVFKEGAQWAPDAVFYDGPQGKYLLRDMELFDLGKDLPEEQVRYNIWNLRSAGVEYTANSNVRHPQTFAWNDPATVGTVEQLLKQIPNKLDAKSECADRLKYASNRASGQSLNASSLEIAARLDPASIKDVSQLANAQGDIDAAKNALSTVKADCAAGTPAGYHAASVKLKTAEEKLESAANILVWLPVSDK